MQELNYLTLLSAIRDCSETDNLKVGVFSKTGQERLGACLEAIESMDSEEQDMMLRATKQSAASIIEFKNGSYIKFLPVREDVRGYAFNRVLYMSNIEKEILDCVIRPTEKSEQTILERKEMVAMTNKERFVSLCNDIDREGMQELMEWLEKSDFYSAPASTKFHGNYAGGLLEHSLNVYDELKRLLQIYGDSVSVSESTIRIVSLFHDLCKVNFYTTEKRYRKNSAGLWESYDAYSIKEKLCYGGHGSKSVFIVQNFMNLTPEEAVSINCHMASWDGNKDVGNAFEQFPLAWLVHVADEAATFITEKKE